MLQGELGAPPWHCSDIPITMLWVLAVIVFRCSSARLIYFLNKSHTQSWSILIVHHSLGPTDLMDFSHATQCEQWDSGASEGGDNAVSLFKDAH